LLSAPSSYSHVPRPRHSFPTRRSSDLKPPFAVVEFEKRVGEGVKKVRQKLAEGANLYELSGSLPVYKNHTITEINGYLNKIVVRSEEHTSELQSRENLVCRLLLEKKKQ